MGVFRWLTTVLLVLQAGFSGAEPVDHHGLQVDPRAGAHACIACHDGLIATEAHYCMVNCSFRTPHPISVPYPSQDRDASYLPQDSLERAGIVLVDGKVVCVSCHNLNNPVRYHLVMDNAGSQLCYACHRK